MTGKRPYPPGGEEGDAKRIRSNDGSPAAPVSNGASEAERKKSDLAAKMAAVKAKLAVAKTNGAPEATPPAPVASAASNEEIKRAKDLKKIADMKAKIAAQRQSAVNGAVAAQPPPQPPSESQKRMIEVRAKAAELANKRTNGTSAAPPPPPPPRQDGWTAKGGLGVGLHPSLLADTGGFTTKSRSNQTGPKFSTTKGNQQSARSRPNPYLSSLEQSGNNEQDALFDPAVAARKGGERKSKQLVFNQKGKFMAQANALRQQAKLEEMKRRIAAENRKTEIEEASDKAFLVPKPPEVEWWDEALLAEGQNTYEDCDAAGRNRIETDDSIITVLIQRPVLLQAPQDKFIPAPKPLMLTSTEQKKLRRQRRMADMKEEQAKIKLGLVEPPPPKVKKSNMMRVLGEQAVKDPTAVEARVNREIAQRAADHEQANLDRMLSKEQRVEKLKSQQTGDEAKGVKIAVFRVDNLSSGKHRYQVDINAKQNTLTGMVVLNPFMNLVIVEGGEHSIKAFKKLMLKRIKWTENTAPLDESNPSTFTGTTDGSNANAATGTRGNGSKAAAWCNPVDENGVLKDLSENRCFLVWEGDEPARSFKRWGSRACETDGEAKDILSRQKMENMWTLARSKS